MEPTQVQYPWRATVRTIFQAFVGLCALVPTIIAMITVTDSTPAAVATGIGVALSVSTFVTRLMALPEVNAWIEAYLPWLAASDDAKPLDDRGSVRVPLIAAVVAAAMLAGVGLWLVDRPSPEPPAPAPTQTVTVNLADPPTTATLEQMSDTPPGDAPNGDSPANPAPVGTHDPSSDLVVDGVGAGAQTFVSTANLRRANPWTPQQAVAYAIGQALHPDKNYYQRCEHFVAWVYGWGGSGYTSAKEHANAVPKNLRYAIPSDASKIPAGAAIYFFDGTWGHTVISVGNGKVASNDIVTPGRIDIVPLSRFGQKWGYYPDFWTQPEWLPGFGKNPNPAPKIVTAPAKPAKPVVNLKNIQKAARTHGDASGVRHYRRNLGMSDGTHFGKGAITRYREWQREEGFRGPDADGIPGCKTSKALKRRGPDKNWVVKCP